MEKFPLNNLSPQYASSMNLIGVLKSRELLFSKVISGVATGAAELFPSANQHTLVGKNESWHIDFVPEIMSE